MSLSKSVMSLSIDITFVNLSKSVMSLSNAITFVGLWLFESPNLRSHVQFQSGSVNDYVEQLKKYDSKKTFKMNNRKI